MDQPKYPVRVSVSEAARLFGVDPHTIRRALRREELRYIVVQGRYKINFESLVVWSQNRITVKNKFEQKGIGQFVDKWKIKNKKFSPDPKIIAQKEDKQKPDQG
jgi:excisionase family DNA binding protein